MIQGPAKQNQGKGDGRTKYAVHQGKMIAEKCIALNSPEKNKKEKQEEPCIGLVKASHKKFIQQ